MSVPVDQMPIAAPTPPGGAPTPPMGLQGLVADKGLMADKNSTQNDIAALQEQKNRFQADADEAKKDEQFYRDQQAEKLAPYEAELAKPFGDKPPQYNIGELMKTAPIWTIIGALAGSRGGATGIAGLAAINGMVSGLVKGDTQAYEAHMREYEEKRREWTDYAARIKTIVSEIQGQFKNDIVGAAKAKQAALNAFGHTDMALKDANNRVALIDKTAAQLDMQKQRIYQAATAKSNKETSHAIRDALAMLGSKPAQRLTDAHETIKNMKTIKEYTESAESKWQAVSKRTKEILALPLPKREAEWQKFVDSDLQPIFADLTSAAPQTLNLDYRNVKGLRLNMFLDKMAKKTLPSSENTPREIDELFKNLRIAIRNTEENANKTVAEVNDQLRGVRGAITKEGIDIPEQPADEPSATSPQSDEDLIKKYSPK
jgi:hypothetical protein